MRMPRLSRIRTAILAGTVAAVFLGTTASLSPADAPAPAPAPKVTVVKTGDDNRDGRIDEDETGWDCATMGNRTCGDMGRQLVNAQAAQAPARLIAAAPLECEHPDVTADVFALCVDVAWLPPYGWTNPDGSTVDLPAGDVLIRELDETPGTPDWADALRALRAEYTEHTQR
ncbi:hypothetical protein ACIO3O_37020 [Streptomyces sp. NPDC087440]|uniref:hypothetical protein n=1 Tax=Streptomyces sp. NPDC087440 TaxID=3365790 RepID=UPI00382B7DC0